MRARQDGSKPTRRPKARLAAAMCLCLLALGCGATATSSGQCAPPTIDTEPARAAPTAPFQLHGENFFKGCNDTGGDAPEKPVRDIRVEFRQGDRTWHLATVDANRSFAFDEELRVPADTAPGRAVVRAIVRFDEPAEAPFRVVGDD